MQLVMQSNNDAIYGMWCIGTDHGWMKVDVCFRDRYEESSRELFRIVPENIPEIAQDYSRECVIAILNSSF